MQDDKEISMQALDVQSRGKDYSLPEIPGFKVWAEKKSLSGASEDAIDSMFSMAMYLLPEEVAAVTDDDFNELYEEIIDDFR